METPPHLVQSSTTKRNQQKLSLHLLELNLNRSDPISVINFLTELANTVDDLKISETESYLSIAMFINPPAETHYRVTVSMVTCATQMIF